MKLRKILMGLAAVVGFTTAATAATPVGVWDGFNSLTSGDYTWTKSAGTTVEEGVVTIGSDGGLTIANPTGLGDKAVTFIADIEGFDPDGAQMTIFDIGIGANRVNISSRPSDNNVYQLWNADNGYGNVGTISTGKVRIITTYSGGSGTTTYVVGGNTADSGKLKSSGTAIDALGIGCYKGTERVAEGMKIYRLAMFNSKLSEAEAKTYSFPSEIYYATMDGDRVFGALKWNPEKPSEGFTATDTLIITNTATSLAELKIDENLSALQLKIVSEPAEDEAGVAITTNGNVTVAISTYDFSEAESKTIIAYETSASVVAGADTGLVGAKNPSLTIAEGKKLTVSYETDVAPTLTASKVSNAGTLHFMGGEAGDPIALTGNANFGVITLDENTYVKNTVDNNRNHIVTGSGFSSFYAVSKASGEPGMGSVNAFTNLTFVTDTASGSRMWVERITLDDDANVGLLPITTMYLAEKGFTAKMLNGSGAVTGNALTINCAQDSNYSGASAVAFTIGGEAVQTLSGAYTGALTVNEDAQVKLTGAANPSSISGLGSVTITSGTGVATNTSDTAKFTGTITVDASVTTLFLGTSRPKCDFIFAGTTEIVYTENVSDDGVVQQLNITSGTVSGYKVMGIDGEEKEVTEGKYTPSVTGKAALRAYEFNGNLTNTGSANVGNLGNDNGPFYDITSNEVFALTQPYSKVAEPMNWPENFTVAIHSTLPDKENACLIAWGTLTGGGIGLTTGDPTKNEVKMVYWPKDQAYTPLATMTVPNAQKSKHLYVFTKTADTLKIYLDGSLVVNYNGAYSLGNGFQVGSVHGGIGNTGLGRLDVVYGSKTDTNACYSVINSMRIYNTVLGPNAMAELKREFPYVSPNGTFTRALTGEANQWVALGAWTKVGEAEPYAAPDAESTVALSAAEEATITLNLEEPTDYEALELTGEGEITIAAAAANTNKISSSGHVTIGADATIEYSAMSLAGTPINIAPGKTLTIDCSMIDLSQYYASTTIPLTGLVTGEGEIAFEVPEKVTGRSAEAQFNESNNTWELKITVISAPFIYDGGEWTWSGESVSTETVSNNTAVSVLVRSGTLEWPMDRAEFEVQGGTLKATKVGTSTITVSGGAFDVNGLRGSLYTVILNGGSLVNNGARIGDANQITAINLTDDSTVGGLYDFSLQGNASGQYGKTLMNLDQYTTLTKTGTNSFALVNTTIDGKGTLYVEEGEVYSSESTVFTNGTLKIGKNGTFRQRADGRTLTIAKIVGEGGLFDQRGTVSDFTLEGTLNIANAGTYGTITLSGSALNPATLNAGEKRGLALEGEGTVNAQLTLVEMAAAEPLTLFTTTEGEFDVYLTDYNGRELEPGTDYTIEGGVVTPKAIPFIYNDGWTWNKDSVEASTVQSLTGVDIIVEGGTCEWNIDRDITVNGGTLKATGTKKANAAITVGEEGTFDVNGRENTEWTVLLKGGSLVNNGTAIGNTKKQINLLTVVDADSTVDAAANFGLIKAGYNPTTLDLGGQKLTKTGAATFWLCNATVTNGTFEVAEGTLQTVGEKDERVVVFADASLVLDEGTTLAVTRPLTIGAIEADGATINNTKSITAFTLKGEATLSGNGTWGTITLDSKIMNPAVLNVGNLRGFTLAGDGTVNVQLTEAEFSQYEPIEVFDPQSEDVVFGTVKKADGTVLTVDEDYMITGGSITIIDKRIAVESVELSETTKTLKVGDTFQLQATIKPVDATVTAMIWASEDPLIATVDQSGNVEAISAGTTNITVSVEDYLGNIVQATCVVTVQNAIEPIDPSAGGEIKCDTPQAATNLAEAITGNPWGYIKAPEGLDATATAMYQMCFAAEVAPDGTTVQLKLNEEGEDYLQGIVDEATDDPDIAAALIDPTATSVTYADGTFMLGFYYWVAGGTDVKSLTTNGEAVQPTAYGDMTLEKPDLGTTTQGFYVIKADFKAPKPAADELQWQQPIVNVK